MNYTGNYTWDLLASVYVGIFLGCYSGFKNQQVHKSLI